MQLATSGHDGQTNEQSAADEPDNLDNSTENVEGAPSEWSALAAMDVGTEVLVKRTAPEFAKGWLGSVDLDGSGPSGVLEKIRARHGGGTFLLQPRGRSSNGRRLFSGGSVRVEVCGFPLVDGRPVGPNGPLSDVNPVPAMSPAMHAAPPMGYPQPYPVPQVADSGIQGELLGLVSKALQKGDASIDLAGVINALNGLGLGASGPVAQPVDPYKQVKQTLELTELLRAQAAGNDGNRESVGGDDRMGRLMEMMMMKFMAGESAPARPHSPQVRAASPQNPTPMGGPLTPQPSPHHVWHPGRGWLPWSGAPESRREQPATGAATPSPPGGGSFSENETETEREFVGSPGSPPTVKTTILTEDDYVDPIEPEELVGELEVRSHDDQVAFVRKLFAMVGNNPELQAAVMEGIAGVAEPGEQSGGLEDSAESGD